MKHVKGISGYSNGSRADPEGGGNISGSDTKNPGLRERAPQKRYTRGLWTKTMSAYLENTYKFVGFISRANWFIVVVYGASCKDMLVY